MKNNKKREGGHRIRTTKMDAQVVPTPPLSLQPTHGWSDHPRVSRSALFGHRGWLSKIGVLHFSPTHFKKKDKIEKEGLKKRNREKINTKVGQPI